MFYFVDTNSLFLLALIWNWIYMMAGYNISWSPIDKGAINAEMHALKNPATANELMRVMAYIAQIAKDNGKVATTHNYHTSVGGRNLHSACPFGAIGIYYAYSSMSPPEVYILGLSLNLYNHFPTVAARLVNVP
jgi:hypothetical protein